MDKVLAFSTLVFCIFCLIGTIVCQGGINGTIEGFERDCVNYSCRYTGRIVARFYDPDITPGTRRLVNVQICAEKLRREDCPNMKRLIQVHCNAMLYPCPNRNCVVEQFPCYTDYGNPAIIKFYPVYDGLFQIAVGEEVDSRWGTKMFKGIYSGKIFNSSIKPDNWDPLEKFGPLEYFKILKARERLGSMNGDYRSKSDSFVVGFGIIIAFYLVREIVAE